MLWQVNIRQLALSMACIIPISAYSHGGRTDSNGGHNNRETGVYHCHKESCFSRLQIETATSEAESRRAAFSYIYNRNEWKHWSDTDNDCLNTRHELLKSSSDIEVTMSANGCQVVKGLWYGAYSGNTRTNAADLDIDHLVPIKWAHEHGGANWSQQKKEKFANDPINLIVVDDGLNQSKGAKGPTQWMPPNHIFRCEYLELWTHVLDQYPSLQMTSAELRVFNRQLAACD